MDEFEITRVYPVIDEEPELLFEQICHLGFQFQGLAENKLIPPGVGDLVSLNELYGYDEENDTYGLRDRIYKIANKYGFPNQRIDEDLKAKFDKEVGECAFLSMKITPSVAATLPMWEFLNLKLIPDIIYWRWGDSSDHFYGARRNYLGTQWWRYYLFSEDHDSFQIYKSLSDRLLADLYERPGTRGLPNHIVNIPLWFNRLISEYDITNTQIVFRESLKLYNAELGFRLYFSLSSEDKFNIYKNCFLKAVKQASK